MEIVMTNLSQLQFQNLHLQEEFSGVMAQAV